MAVIERVVVLVPVRDEEATLGACLRSVVAAARQCPLPVALWVLLDCATDRSDLVVDDAVGDAVPFHLVNGAWNGCNRARAAGARAALRDNDPATTWVAATDADSTVPETWLVDQLERANAGAAAVFGAGRITDWNEWPDGSQEAFEREYARAGFCHGFNMGVRGDALAAVGGFSTTLNEDAALRNDLILKGELVVFDRANVVTTSARRVGRCPTGFAASLPSMLERGRL